MEMEPGSHQIYAPQAPGPLERNLGLGDVCAICRLVLRLVGAPVPCSAALIMKCLVQDASQKRRHHVPTCAYSFWTCLVSSREPTLAEQVQATGWGQAPFPCVCARGLCKPGWRCRCIGGSESNYPAPGVAGADATQSCSNVAAM